MIFLSCYMVCVFSYSVAIYYYHEVNSDPMNTYLSGHFSYLKYFYFNTDLIFIFLDFKKIYKV